MRRKIQHTEFKSNEAAAGASATSQQCTQVPRSRSLPPIVDPGWMHDKNSAVTAKVSTAGSPVCVCQGCVPSSDFTVKGCTKPVSHRPDGEAGVSTGEGGWYPPAGGGDAPNERPHKAARFANLTLTNSVRSKPAAASNFDQGSLHCSAKKSLILFYGVSSSDRIRLFFAER